MSSKDPVYKTDTLIGEDINVEIKLDTNLGNIKADPGQLEQILVNI